MQNNTELNQGKIFQVLNWGYDKALNGAAGLYSASELAEGYMNGNGTTFDKANSLVRWQCAKTGTSGFVTNLGGWITMPVGIPANISSVVYVQIRMVAAIAHMGGFDIQDDRVKTLVYVCLVGNKAQQILKQAGVSFGRQVAQSAVNKISGRALIELNKKVGFRLATKFGERGIVNFGKAVPLAGGLVGGSFDYATTKGVGKAATMIFIE